MKARSDWRLLASVCALAVGAIACGEPDEDPAPVAREEPVAPAGDASVGDSGVELAEEFGIAPILLRAQQITAGCVTRDEARTALATIASLIEAPTGDGAMDEDAVVAQIAVFADHLYCVSPSQLRSWDVELASRLDTAFAEPGCSAFHAVWNPALLVADFAQLDGSSEIVVRLARHRSRVEACVGESPLADTWLDQFGTGNLLPIGRGPSRARLVGAITTPDRLGLGLCPLAEHALSPRGGACYRGFDPFLCSDESQEDLAELTTAHLLDLGLAHRDVEELGEPPARGPPRRFAHRATIHQAGDFFGVPRDTMFSRERPMMQSFCGGGGDGGGGVGPLGLEVEGACSFRDHVVALIAQRRDNDVLACNQHALTSQLTLLLSPPVQQPNMIDPTCFLTQDESGDDDEPPEPEPSDSDDSSDDELDRLMLDALNDPMAQTEPNDVRVDADDARAFERMIRDIARANGLASPPRPSAADFAGAAAAANDALRNAQVHESPAALSEAAARERAASDANAGEARTDAEHGDLDVINQLVDGLMQVVTEADGSTGYRIHVIGDGDRSRAARHEAYHVMQVELGWDSSGSIRREAPGLERTSDGTIRSTSFGETESVAHSAMRRLGVYRPRPDEAGWLCNETGAERRARLVFECLRGRELQDRIEAADPLAPLIYVVDPPQTIDLCRDRMDPADGFTDPSPIEDGPVIGGGGPNYNDPNIGAIDPCPDGACAGIGARLPEGYDRDQLNALIGAARRRVGGGGAAPPDPSARPRVVALPRAFTSESP